MQVLGKPAGQSVVPANTRIRLVGVTAARVGDVGFVGLDCDTFNEIGKAIKAGSPFSQTFVITICNGGSGYLPTTEAFNKGG